MGTKTIIPNQRGKAGKERPLTKPETLLMGSGEAARAGRKIESLKERRRQAMKKATGFSD